MNSLNILSSRVIGQSSNSSRHRSKSQGDSKRAPLPADFSKLRSYSEDNFRSLDHTEKSYDGGPPPVDEYGEEDVAYGLDEKTPLLQEAHKNGTLTARSTWRLITQRFFDAITETLKFILSTFAAPGVYLAQCFQADDGRYSLLAPVRKLRRSSAAPTIRSDKGATRIEGRRRSGSTRKLRPRGSHESIISTTSESETDRRHIKNLSSGRNRPTKTKTHDPGPIPEGEEHTPRRSIRIKLHNEESLKRQRHRRTQSSDLGHPMPEGVSRVQGAVHLDSLKSPTSPNIHRITKYPHSPTPPRPLLPPRVPSYTAAPRNARPPQKTLVLDLDETLIHSLAKGGRMSSGHMVEVKLSIPTTTSLSPGGPQTTLGPQHPILYYVHKRPHCDEFLRKVSKWYKLVIFTASVQEYADPVIDWLESERKYFQGRLYRQHCTFRNGAYIKDLSSVEPDLSKVMILDNSPMSYIFHEDNAIPIEGWINDPTDNGLLHLIPMLEALQSVTDVRALLALRRGEIES
ncbi:NLI interacting factor [Penicillium cf. griseofulvum]|uniref:NLI interacting factor n=1 Tax=Penicillium cf. griseofulvum TaxID=2972120 RepID=A0A9W9M1C3_9EURO|nr:NLI interacting factor [Penicillium cf. griseofulvum]KAJ5429193.1 NLI interacting factor [Penicillium cf. griseofulvum]KAJ5437015.1 NLI interacting factor [Penicillium cf. griseofulvum]